MSLPTSRLAKLAISGMPPTSSTTARDSRSKDDPVSSSDESSGSSDDSDDESGTSTSGRLTSKNTKLDYDASRLSPTSLSRARAGFTTPFTFTDCSTYDQALSTEYFAFQISEIASYYVRLGAPGSEHATPTCYCNIEPKPCPHIFFLLDQIADHTLSDEEKKQPLPLSKDGVPREALDAFQKVKEAGQDLIEKLKLRSVISTGSQESFATSSHISAGAERINDVKDILSSFSSTKSTDDYRPDIFNNSNNQPASNSQLHSKDLEKTLALSMVSNDDLFRQMRTIVSPSHCASDYFQKKHQKALDALKAMDNYTSTKRRPQGMPDPDIPWCASIVEKAVEDIVGRLNKARAPLSLSARQSAAQALSQILQELTMRNIDVYATPIWANTRQGALPVQERNIFVRFYGYEPKNGRKFILENLAELGDAARPYLELLEEAAEAFGGANVATAYGNKYRSLVRDLKVRGRGSSSGSKRPGDESGGDSKRMK